MSDCCHSHPAETAESGASNHLAEDPVCGMSVEATPDAISLNYQKKTYYFCCGHCKDKFVEDPKQFLDPALKRSKKKPAAVKGAIYFCPMDPEVEQDHPGACPKCGMALEPMLLNPTHNDIGTNHEYVEMKCRFWLSAAFSIPLFALSMGRMENVLPSIDWYQIASENTWQWIEAALATPAVFWAGWPILQRAVASIQNRHFNMFTLIGLGVSVAYGVSIIAVSFPGLFPAAYQHHHTAPVYFESAAIITSLVLLGQMLESGARAQTGKAIEHLLALAPRQAIQVFNDGHEEDIDIEDIEPGMWLRLLPGAKVPVDGIVVSGESHLDESLLSGESMPVAKQPGTLIAAGTVNGTGSLVMQARQVGQDTILSQIIQTVQQAQRSRPPIQRLADQVAGIFVPVVLIASLITAVAWYIFGPAEERLSFALLNAVSVLLIACPCAVGLATPLSIMVGIGKGATSGILVKNAEALEQLADVDTIVFDKTGTLTEGKPSLRRIVMLAGGWEENQLLQVAASLENLSEHPIADAIVNAAHKRDLEFLKVEKFESIAGQGILGYIDNSRFVMGNRQFLAWLNLPSLENIDAILQHYDNTPETVVFIATKVDFNWHLLGYITVSDAIKSNARQAISKLHGMQLKTVMMSGDQKTTAVYIAGQLGIDDVHAPILPKQKANLIQGLQQKKRRVAMAGDGVNDAPALAQANVGIAMDTGSDVAIENASITLLRGDIAAISRAMHLSKATLSNIRQNLFFAFFYNVIGIPIAAGILYPAFGILLNPMIAAAAMSLSSICVALNALRLRSIRL